MPVIFSDVSAQDNGTSVDILLRRADECMFDFKYGEAKRYYEQALKAAPDDYEVLWRLSRFYTSYGEMAEKKREKKERWKKGQEYAQRAAEINPEGADAYLYLAASMGKITMYSSPKEKVKYVWKIKEAVEKAIELDPTQQKSYVVLGVWHRKVATASSIERSLAKMFFGRLPEGSLEESLRLLLKARDMGGNTVRNFYELGLTYEELNRPDEAKEVFLEALKAETVIPGDDDKKKKIEKILSKTKYKKR